MTEVPREGPRTAPPRIVLEPISSLATLDEIPIRFEVRSVLEVEVLGNGLGGIRLTEREIERPYVKDYDVDAGEGPSRLAERFDVSHWGLLLAHRDGAPVGGALIAWRTPTAHLLEGRNDLAVLWDFRVLPELRGQGVGSALFRAAEAWAKERGCTHLKVETQNVNVPACRFYAARGCTLGGVHRLAYPTLPSETQLLWYKSLTG